MKYLDVGTLDVLTSNFCLKFLTTTIIFTNGNSNKNHLGA